MNHKKSLIVLIIGFAGLLIAAYFAYDSLKDEVDAPQISGLEMKEESEAADIETNHDEVEEKEENEPEQMMAMDFTVYDLDGNAMSLSELKGKPVVLNFWASWCNPCTSEMPVFHDAYLEYQEELHFMMVNMTDGSKETLESASTFIAENGFEFPVYYDTDVNAALVYNVYSLPTTYFIDEQGYLAAYGQGSMSREVLQSGIDMILPKE